MTNSIFHDIKQAFKNGNYLFQIIIVNAVVFVGLNLVIALTPKNVSIEIIRFFALSADVSTYYWMVWTYFTYMFTHLGLSHFIFNMLWLYWMGIILSDLYGHKRVLELYVYGGLAGGFIYVISALILPVVSINSYLIGASAGVMAVMIAIGVLQPNYKLHLPFLGPIAIKYIVLIGFLTSTVVDLNFNTGGKLAHFGGAAYGVLFAYYLPRGLDINEPITKWFLKIFELFKSQPKIKVVHSNKNFKKSNEKPKVNQSTIDAILDKISKYGYDSLSKKEKDDLFKFGKQ